MRKTSTTEKTKLYRAEIDELVTRAKLREPNAKGLNLGERFFVELLHHYIAEYKIREITDVQLRDKKRELESLLIDYWIQAHMFREDVKIRNRMSQTLTEAEKNGCPICKRLIRIFDGREKTEYGKGKNHGI